LGRQRVTGAQRCVRAQHQLYGRKPKVRKMKALCRISTAFYLAFALLVAIPLFSQDSDPPGRVARLSYMEGSVSFEPSGENSWSQATLNYPLTAGDRLWTDKGARAELETGNIAMRMSEQTDLTATSLTDQLLQLGLAQGSLRVTAYDLRSGSEVEVDTSNAAVTILQAGSYRVDTYPDQNVTLVTVNRGEVQVTGNGLNQTVGAGQALRLSGSGQVQADWVDVPGPDGFDQWCGNRDQRYLASTSRRYVSSYVPGYYDLDQYGNWEAVSQYGPIWYPSGLAVGWCPYRYGRWAWVEPWGWTWVDQAPWGFAPFHYGRWVQIGPRWGWLPGPIAVAPIYGPAFVAFVGGGGFADSFGVGGVAAWFPLGPGEPFYPWYHHSDGYLRQINVTNVRNINVTNITNITNINNIHYRYQTVAATAVPANVFRNAEPVARNLVKVNPQQLARAQVIPHPEINPTPRALAAGNPATHPPVGTERPVIVQHAPVGHPGEATTATRNAPPANNPRVNENVARPPTPNEHGVAQPNRNNPPAGNPSTENRPANTTTAVRPPPVNQPEVNRGGAPTGHPPAESRPGNTTTAVKPPPINQPEVNRGGPPPSRPALVSKYPPPQQKLPFEQKTPAMQEHPGRPLEPQQKQNLHEGKPAGPMTDREFPPHAAPPAQHAAPAPHPPPSGKGAPPPKH
jgi:hypothetical protein